MPVQPTYPGVYVQEAPSGVRSISGVATSVAAFVGMAPSGPVNVPTEVLNARAFDAAFGGSADVGEMVHQVRQFFLNGGPRAWIVRTAQAAGDGSALMATSTIRTEDEAVSAFTVAAKNAGSAGNNVRVEVDYNTPSPERTFNLSAYATTVNSAGGIEKVLETRHLNLSIDPRSARYAPTIVNAGNPHVSLSAMPAVPANLTGFSQSALVFDPVFANIETELNARIDATHRNIVISVAGGPPVTVDLFPLAIGPTQNQIQNGIAQPINNALASQLVQVTVTLESFSGGRCIRITSASGAVVISDAATSNAAAVLELGTANGGIECDAYTALRPAPTGYVTRLHAFPTLLTRLNNLAAIDKADFGHWRVVGALGVSDGPNPTFAVAGLLIRGAAAPPPRTLGSLNNLATNLQTIADQITAVPGRRYAARVDGLRLAIAIGYGGHDSDLELQLSNPGNNGASITGNQAIAQSAANPCNVTAYAIGLVTPAALIAANQPAGDFRVFVRSGSDGEPPLPADYSESYSRLERDADIFNMLILPRAKGTNVQGDADRANLWAPASAFCKARRAFLIADPNSDGGDWNTARDAVNDLLAFRSGLNLDHTAIYWPRVKISDPKGKTLTVDPSGTMAGVYAATDTRRGIWKAPAGLEASLIGVKGLQYAVTDDENDITNPQALNTLRMMSTGSVSWGARTMMGFDEAPGQDWKYIPVRRLALHIEESLYRGLKFAVFEPNDEPLWAQIRLAAGAFMNGLFRQGAFKGQKSSEAYYVACDASTTLANDINLGRVNVEIGFAPLKPAEFVVITIQQLAGQIEV